MFVGGGVSSAGYVKFSKKRLASAGRHCPRNPAGRIDRNPTHNYPPTSNYSSPEGLRLKSPLREGGKQRDRASSAPPRGEEVRPTALVIVRQFIYSYELSGNSQTLPKPGRIRDGAPWPGILYQEGKSRKPPSFRLPWSASESNSPPSGSSPITSEGTGPIDHAPLYNLPLNG